jgi:hypothetical protein
MTFYVEAANKIVTHNADVLANGDSLFVVQGVTIGSATDWDGVDAGAGCSFQIQGTIMSAGGNALYLSGGGNHVNVGAAGAIMGNLGAGAGLNAATGHLTLTNAGEISGYYASTAAPAITSFTTADTSLAPATPSTSRGRRTTTLSTLASSNLPRATPFRSIAAAAVTGTSKTRAPSKPQSDTTRSTRRLAGETL